MGVPTTDFGSSVLIRVYAATAGFDRMGRRFLFCKKIFSTCFEPHKVQLLPCATRVTRCDIRYGVQAVGHGIEERLTSRHLRASGTRKKKTP